MHTELPFHVKSFKSFSLWGKPLANFCNFAFLHTSFSLAQSSVYKLVLTTMTRILGYHLFLLSFALVSVFLNFHRGIFYLQSDPIDFVCSEVTVLSWYEGRLLTFQLTLWCCFPSLGLLPKHILKKQQNQRTCLGTNVLNENILGQDIELLKMSKSCDLGRTNSVMDRWMQSERSQVWLQP